MGGLALDVGLVAAVASADRECWLMDWPEVPALGIPLALERLQLRETTADIGDRHGLIDCDRGTITVNSHLEQLVDRQTNLNYAWNYIVMHEVGHWRLHRWELRRGFRSREQEREAHIYAAVFLVPKRRVLESPGWARLMAARDSEGKVPFNLAWAISCRLADELQVTPSAVLVRLEEIGEATSSPLKVPRPPRSSTPAANVVELRRAVMG